MTRPQQLSEELRLVNKTSSLLGLRLIRPPEPRDPPLPDFALALDDGRTVGLEITEARDPEIAEAWGGTLPRFRDQIKAALARDGVSARVWGSVPVEELIALRKQARATAVETIASIVRSAMPAGLRPTNGSKFPGLGFLGYLAAEHATSTSVDLASRGEPLGPDIIQLAIDRKASKLGGYAALGASEYWLLVVGGATLGGYVTVDDARSRTFASPFSKTIFLDDSEDNCDYLTTLDDSGHIEP